VPFRASVPAVFNVTLVLSVTGPVTVSALPSARLNPPTLLNAAKVATALPALPSVVVPAEEPVRLPAAIVPPVWLIAAPDIRPTEVDPAIAPAVCVMPPATLAPFLEARVITGAVTLPPIVSAPVLLSATDWPSVTGPATVSG
jgi:hypothetical protein